MMPIVSRFLPVLSWSMTGAASVEAIANDSPAIGVPGAPHEYTTPITLPFASTTGLPELPGYVWAVIWISWVTEAHEVSALYGGLATIPFVSV